MAHITSSLPRVLACRVCSDTCVANPRAVRNPQREAPYVGQDSGRVSCEPPTARGPDQKFGQPTTRCRASDSFVLEACMKKTKGPGE